MNVSYGDRPVLSGDSTKEPGPSTSRRVLSDLAGRPKHHRVIREPADVRIGRKMAKPLGRKNQRVSFVLGDFTSESSSDMVSLSEKSLPLLALSFSLFFCFYTYFRFLCED